MKTRWHNKDWWDGSIKAAHDCDQNSIAFSQKRLWLDEVILCNVGERMLGGAEYSAVPWKRYMKSLNI